MTHYAQFGIERAYFSQEWAQKLAAEKFGADVMAALPRYVRGPTKGQLKVKELSLEITRCTRGGWVKEGRYDFDAMTANGHVERRVGKVLKIELIRQPYMGRREVLATWDLDVEGRMRQDAAAELAIRERAERFPNLTAENAEAAIEWQNKRIEELTKGAA